MLQSLAKLEMHLGNFEKYTFNKMRYKYSCRITGQILSVRCIEIRSFKLVWVLLFRKMFIGFIYVNHISIKR